MRIKLESWDEVKQLISRLEPMSNDESIVIGTFFQAGTRFYEVSI